MHISPQDNRIVRLRPLLSALALFMCAFSAEALPEQPLAFNNISINEGLSQSTVFDVAQDRRGNIWVATADGLNKYDSYSFTVYRNSQNDSTSISDNMIRMVYADQQGDLWTGTMSGLSLYDAQRDSFRNFTIVTRDKNKLQVYDIEQIDEKTLILATNIGIVFFDKAKYRFEIKEHLSRMRATSLAKKDRQILVGTSEGLYLYTPSNDQISMQVKELQGKNIMSLLMVPYTGLWVGTEGDGLYFVDMNYHVAHHFTHQKSDPGSLSSNFIRALCLDYKQRLWVGTFGGLNIYDAGADSFESYVHDKEESASISHNSVRAIFMDNQGGMWLGSYFGGLDYHHPLRNRFGLMRPHLKRSSLNDDIISCIVEEPASENLWIGTNDNGVNYYDIESERFTHYVKSESNPNSLPSNNIKAILPDGRGNAYVGAHEGGLSYIERSTGSIRHYGQGNSSLVNNSVYSLVWDRNDKDLIWVGTLGGLQQFDVKKGLFLPVAFGKSHPELSDRPVLFLYYDSGDGLWIGCDKGLFLYDAATDKFESRYLSSIGNQLSDYVLSVQEDSKGNIWVGTRSGLFRIGENGSDVVGYMVADGLPNDVIYGILEDSFGRMWLSTNKGLVCFDVKNGTFRTYMEGDGIQSNQFNNYSYCKTSNGMFYFGGIKGITFFRPEHLMDNPFTPGVTIDALTLFNREVLPGDATGILEKHINETRRIALRADQNLFGLHFVSPNFLSGKKNTFMYMLEGFDQQWYKTERHDVSYSNLAPGVYTFKVNAANNDGKWSADVARIEIEVLPVWYKTLWVRAFFIGILTIILYGIVHFFMARAEMKKNEEFNRMKVRFFINLTHELRTPLTLILSPLQEILQRGVPDKWLKGQLDYMQRSSKRLLHLVNQMLDYRRAELGVFELKVAERPVAELANDIFMLFYKTAKLKNIDYEFISQIGEKAYPIDINYLERILLNLLSNAFKFTPQGGRITVRLSEKSRHLHIEVSDTGCGIAKEDQKRIFERFYHVYKDNMCTGIGLSLVKRLVELHHGNVNVESVLGEGAHFTVELPVGMDAYLEKEKGDGLCESESLPDLPMGLSQVVDVSEVAVPMALAVQDEQDASRGERPTILIVEDNLEVLGYMQSNFSQHYNVLTANNGEEGLYVLKENEVDLVITDVMMPVMDGLKFCRAIKQNIRTCHIMVVMLTAKSKAEEQLEGLRSGADDYLPKPFTFSILAAKVGNLLKTRARLRHHYASSTDIEPEKITFNVMDEELLKKCMKIIEDNMESVEFSVDDLAREMGMSRSNLHIKLKAITGESTIEFVRKIKFNYACRLLREGRYTIAEISVMAGFNTPSYFATSFKKHVGCLPTEYIKTVNS